MHDDAREEDGGGRWGRDLWLFWGGQTLSQLGSSFTAFAVPLLVYELTGSALGLGVAAAVNVVPYLLFGLVLGAWADRSDRKRLMVAVDLARAAVVASVPAVALFGPVPVYWLYAVQFASSTLTIVFEACEFAAVPSLAPPGGLTRLNGRVQASYAAAGMAGPLLAGALLAAVPASGLLLADALTFLLSALSLARVRASFNAGGPAEGPPKIADEVREGLRYVVGHPVLRNVALMMALMNLVYAATTAQLVLLLRARFGATGPQVGAFFAASGLGMATFALLAGPLRRRLSYGAVALGALALHGAATIALGLTRRYELGLALWTVCGGTAMLFNVVTGSYRQAIVPDGLLGRVMTVASVLSWSMIPLGALASGAIIDRTGDVAGAYLAAGVAMVAIPLAFAFTSIGRGGDEASRPEGAAPHGGAPAPRAEGQGAA